MSLDGAFFRIPRNYIGSPSFVLFFDDIKFQILDFKENEKRVEETIHNSQITLFPG